MKPHDSMVFRSLQKKDVEEVLEILTNLSEKNKKIFHPHNFDEKTIIENLNSNDQYFVLILNDKIIGYSFLRLFGYDIPSLGCCIHKEYENKDFGTILTKKTIDKARDSGYNKVILKTHKENIYAQKIYEKLGFQYVGETEDKKQYKMELDL